MTEPPRIAVVIPCYKVTGHVLGVIAAVGTEVSAIYCVDDACPAGSGDLVERMCQDPRVSVLRHSVNQGVGGAVMTGYRAALADRADIIVKIDGDGQMDPALLPLLIEPILAGAADYTKGNRFYRLDDVREMPTLRLIGNAGLSFLTKLSTGYWRVFDPTNGFTAIHARVAGLLRFEKIARRFFFESDILFHLGLERAVVIDVPIRAHYGSEVSNLKISHIILPYLGRHATNTFKRVVYSYFIRDFSLASIEIIAGAACLLFGIAYGLAN
ncbi:MAG: glycosyltransferase family 2 protein [Rhodospirillaceae bacterium]